MDLDINYVLKNLKVQNFQVILQVSKKRYEGFFQIFIFYESFIQFLRYCKRDHSFSMYILRKTNISYLKYEHILVFWNVLKWMITKKTWKSKSDLFVHLSETMKRTKTQLADLQSFEPCKKLFWKYSKTHWKASTTESLQRNLTRIQLFLFFSRLFL